MRMVPKSKSLREVHALGPSAPLRVLTQMPAHTNAREPLSAAKRRGAVRSDLYPDLPKKI